MPAPWTPQFIRLVHDAPGQIALLATGGGSLAISALLTTPGASRTVLEAAVPYSSEALIRWLHARPEQFCSERAARMMAMAAYGRALEFVGGEPADAGPAQTAVAGMACTASLASDRPKQGPHRIHAALQTSALTLTHSIELEKGARSRGEEEEIAAALVLDLLAEFKGLAARTTPNLTTGERLAVARCDAPGEWQELLAGQRSLVAATAAAVRRPAAAPDAGRLVFAGAFHPRHEGHCEMARAASKRLALSVEHELSIVNVDKPPIDFLEMRRRAAQFSPDEPLWFSRAATFVEKAALFPRATFIVGADTILRIAEARYYGGVAARDAALALLAAAGCRFLVFGRHYDGSFQSLCAMELPSTLKQLCDEVPADDFRRDVSSTALRTRAAAE